MATSSRIFVKGLPPTITEADFRKHFSFQGHDTTDIRLFSNRRIGYVGYRTSEDAQKAVKHFNKSFVRMSRIGVELAQPPGERKAPTAHQGDRRVVGSKLSGSNSEERLAPSKVESEDPKLKEFLEVMKPKTKKRAWEGDVAPETNVSHNEKQIAEVAEDASDVEYEEVPHQAKRVKHDPPTVDESNDPSRPTTAKAAKAIQELESILDNDTATDTAPAVSDEDWARSRTSRLLGLLDEEEEDVPSERERNRVRVRAASASDGSEEQAVKHPPEHHAPAEEPSELASIPQVSITGDAEAVRSSMRLFLRNLPFDVEGDQLEMEFAPFGHLEEIHVAVNKKTGTGKGFAYVQFSNADSAERALLEKDGQTFQGRLLHVLPAAAKRESRLDDFELSKLPLKKQQEIKRRREAASVQFNWNALYMNPDAVVSSVAATLGLSKSEVLDPTSSDAAVKQAHAETHIIQETKTYFRSQGVDLDAFKKSQRGDTGILVKNIPFDASRDELRRLFEEHGEIRRFLIPPNSVIAIVEMANATQARAAFGALAYRRMKGSMLFLEKAPRDLFTAPPGAVDGAATDQGVSKMPASDLKSRDDAGLVVPDAPGRATLFVRNLNFVTTTEQLTETFKPLSGFLSARVKTKTDPKKPGQVLSMGFGFLEFRTTSDAQAAIGAMDGHALHGHKLQIRTSHKGADAAEEQRRAAKATRQAGQRTKVIIKNLPFETTKKDVRALFGAYGQLRSVRVPKKMDRAARGFGFADFTTPKEAQSAMDALNDTHLLGRRLVLDFAADEPADAEEEIERMAAKVGGQTNAVAVQRLVGHGRKKFTTTRDDEDV